jgi:hypothetical protein
MHCACPERRRIVSKVGGMNGADQERVLAEDARRLAGVERQLIEHHDRNELMHFRAMHAHERSAEIHDALAELAGGDDASV